MRTSVLIPQLADGAARHHRLVAAFFAAVLLVASPSRAEAPPGCNPPPSAQALDTAPPINLGELKLQLVRYRCTRYDADVAKVLRQARTYLEHEAARVKKPALVLDIDETSLSNWKQIYQNNFGYIAKGDCDFSQGTACAQDAWEQSASAAGGT